jgi:hypothetical protein
VCYYALRAIVDRPLLAQSLAHNHGALAVHSMSYPQQGILHPFEWFDRAKEVLWTYYNAPSTKPPYWPRYFLLCHAVELVLKAYIGLHRDLTKDDFIHDLKKLLDEAINLGLRISPLARHELELLNEAHTKYWPRYPNANRVFVIEHFEQHVDGLFKAVRRAFGGS